MGEGEARSKRRMGGVLLAALFAIALTVAPPAAQPASAAADPLRTRADATYTLDPADGRVHVELKVSETDLKPSSASYIYFYTAFNFALQPEATSIRVSGGSTGSITTKKHSGYIEATVHLNRSLFYKQTTSFTIRYDIVGGKPRSDDPNRVGKAYSTFGVWAWGDAGKSTVEVRVPDGFDARFIGDTLSVTSSATNGTVLRANPADASKFFSIIIAENGDAFAETHLSLDGVEIVVQSWPEDTRWRDAVTGTLRDAMPELRTLIGLDWPVEHELNVREKYTPDLEGYAGFFLTKEQRIEVGEDLDPVVIVHETSHAWFNDDLFLERWIYEGLAEEYAWRVLVATGGDDGGAAELPDLKDPGFADLETWTNPGTINDQATDDNERYGYQAAFWVIHQIVEAAGVDQMRDAFAKADGSLTAYPGAGARETVFAGDSWKRMIDLVEPLDKPDSAAIDEAFRTFVLGAGDERTLVDRRGARDAYRKLLERGTGWLAPWYVRKPLGDWSFADATKRIVEASALLARRDEVIAAAGALDLTPDGALKVAYEGATENLGAATALANRQLEALAAIEDARAKVDAAPALLTQIGLIGEMPRVGYDGARAAFEGGDLDKALQLSASTASLLAGAATVGQQRLIIAVATTIGVLLLLLVLFLLLRRRSRRRRAATALALATALPPTDQVPTEPYGTLAADPAQDHDEGGSAPG